MDTFLKQCFFSLLSWFQNAHTHANTHGERQQMIPANTNKHLCQWKPYSVHRQIHTLSNTRAENECVGLYVKREVWVTTARACVCVHITHNVCFMGPKLSCVSIFMCCVSSLLHVCLHMGVVCVCLGQQTDRRADWPTVPRHLTRHSVRARSHVAGHLISSTDRLTKHTRIWTRRQMWTKGQTRPCSYTQ